MPTLPYMQFYPSDYLAKASHLTTVEHGAYFLLLMYCWTHANTVPTQSDRIARIVRLQCEEWEEIADVILEFFTLDGDHYFNQRIKDDLEKSKNISDRNRANALQSHKSRRATAKTTHSERSAIPEPEPDIKEINKEKNTKHKYGPEKNVLLTDEDVLKLKEDLGPDYDSWITEFSNALAIHGYVYKNHRLTILNWKKKRDLDRGGKSNGHHPSNDVFINKNVMDLSGIAHPTGDDNE